MALYILCYTSEQRYWWDTGGEGCFVVLTFSDLVFFAEGFQSISIYLSWQLSRD